MRAVRRTFDRTVDRRFFIVGSVERSRLPATFTPCLQLCWRMPSVSATPRLFGNIYRRDGEALHCNV